MVSEEQYNKVIPVQQLLDLDNIGFKLVPLGEDAKTPPIPWTPIYEDPSYWTAEKLDREASLFKNVATVFGETRQGYLNELDIDSEPVYDKLFNVGVNGERRSIIDRLIQLTYVVKTKKAFGYRIYWLSHKQNRPVHTSDCKDGHEFELKTDKSCGHSTLPPSRHRDDPNFIYQECGQRRLLANEELYDELLNLLSDCLKPNEERELRTTRLGISVELDNEAIQSICEFILPHYQKGSRHNITFGLCGLLRKLVVSYESALNVIQQLTADDEERISRITVLNGTYKKDAKDVAGYSALSEILEKIIGDKTSVKKLLGKVINTIELAVVNNEDQSLLLWLVDSITKEYIFKTTTDNEELFCYDGTKYVPGQEWRIKQHCQILCPTIRTGMVQEVVNKIKQTTFIDRSEFDSDIDWINMSNGSVNIHTGELRPHSPDQYFLNALPYPYCTACTCPDILAFLGVVLRPRDVFTALQLFGYCLYKSARFHKAFMFVGRGRNGKSVFLSLLEAFLDFVNNCSNATLQELCGGDRFAMADLFGKMANIYADLKNDKLKDTGPFKTLTTGDTVPAQRKYQQRFSFRNHATLVFSANDIPETDDQSLAYFDRWIIFVFETIFLSNEVIAANKNLARYRDLKRDPNLLQKLTTQEELSGLFNLALIGLRQLIKDGGFIHAPTVDDVEHEYRINSGSVQRFLSEKCEVEPSNNFYWTVCDTLYTKYIEYCKENKLVAVGSEEQFGVQIAQAHLRRKQKRIGLEERRPWCYFGVRLKEGDFDH